MKNNQEKAIKLINKIDEFFDYFDNNLFYIFNVNIMYNLVILFCY